MNDWQPIETAPHDGSVVYVRRIYEGRLVTEGEAVFALPHPHAPQLQALGPDPLNRLSAQDYAHEADHRRKLAAEPHWMLPDRMYSFPMPTHWRPAP